MLNKNPAPTRPMPSVPQLGSAEMMVLDCNHTSAFENKFVSEPPALVGVEICHPFGVAQVHTLPAASVYG